MLGLLSFEKLFGFLLCKLFEFKLLFLFKELLFNPLFNLFEELSFEFKFLPKNIRKLN